MSKIFFVILIFGTLLPLSMGAQGTPPQAGASPGLPYWGPLVSCVGAPNSATPAGFGQCLSICDLLVTFRNTAYFGLTLLLFGFVPVMVMVGGLQILTSRGNPEQQGTGKKTLSGAVIGALIGLGAFLIIVTFLWALGLWTNGQFTIQENGGAALATAWPDIACEVAQPASQ